MKKKIFAGALLAAFSAAMLVGCGKKNQEKKDDVVDTTTSKNASEDTSTTSTNTSTTTSAEGDTSTSASVKADFNVEYIDPETGETGHLTAVNGVVSGLPEVDEFTIEDDLFITKYQFVGFFNGDTKIQNGDKITDDLMLYPHQEILNQDLNSNTEEKVDISWRIDELISYFENIYVAPSVVYIKGATGTLNEFAFKNADGTYTTSKYNKLINNYKTSLETLESVMEDESLEAEYDKDGFYISFGEGAKTSYIFDTNLNPVSATMTVSGMPLELNFYNGADYQELSEEEFVVFTQGLQPVLASKLKMNVNVNVENSDLSIYGSAVYEYDDDTKKLEIKDSYNMDSDILEFLDEYKDLTAIEAIGMDGIKGFYVGYNSFRIIADQDGDDVIAEFNLDGSIKKIIFGNKAVAEFQFGYEEGVLTQITFEEFLADTATNDDPLYMDISYKDSISNIYSTVVRIRDEYNPFIIDGSTRMNEFEEYDAIVKGSYGIISYITSLVNIEDVEFYKDEAGYFAIFEKGSYSYQISFDKFGRLTAIDKQNMNNYQMTQFKIEIANEEYGCVIIEDNVFDKEYTQYKPILTEIDYPEISKGKIETDGKGYWYTAIGLIDYDSEEYEKAIAVPGTKKYVIVYDNEDAIILTIYTNYDRTLANNQIVFKKGSAIYDGDTPLFKINNVTGYELEGYYGNPSCTTPVVKTLTYNNNAIIYAKLTPLTLKNYSIMGTGIVGSNHTFNSIETQGPQDLRATTMGCVFVGGTVNAERTADRIETEISSGTIVEFEAKSRANLTINLKPSDATQAKYIEVFQYYPGKPVDLMFVHGVIYKLENGEFIQVSKDETVSEYYFKDTMEATKDGENVILTGQLVDDQKTYIKFYQDVALNLLTITY